MSGGADSGALALLVKDLTSRAVHVDHGLAHSPHLRSAAVAIAHRLGYELHVVDVVVSSGPSPEAMAREARYRALSEVTRSDESVLTAHTADDNLETVIINLVRGTGLSGVAGIPPFRSPNVHRPLLDASRSELREFAMLAGLPFVDDPMNLDPGLTRNRIRSAIVPRLREVNPGVEAAVARMSLSLRADGRYLDTLAADQMPSFGEGQASIPAGLLRTLPEPITSRVAMSMLRHVMGGAGVSMHRVDQVKSVAFGTVAYAELGSGVAVWKSNASVVVGQESHGEQEVVIIKPGMNLVGGLSLEMTKHDRICQVAPLGPWQAIFPADTRLTWEGVVKADGVPAWVPGSERLPVAWYRPGEVGYLSLFAT
jgi:tRNA(Ile)-lysidine synthase